MEQKEKIMEELDIKDLKQATGGQDDPAPPGKIWIFEKECDDED